MQPEMAVVHHMPASLHIENSLPSVSLTEDLDHVSCAHMFIILTILQNFLTHYNFHKWQLYVVLLLVPYGNNIMIILECIRL